MHLDLSLGNLKLTLRSSEEEQLRKKLDAALSDYRNIVGVQSQLEQDFKALRLDHNQLLEERNTLRANLDYRNKDVSQLEEDKHNLQGDVANRNARLSALEQDRDTLNKKNDELISINNRIGTELSNLKVELAPLRKWPAVHKFALAMIERLDYHEPDKGDRDGWITVLPVELLKRVREETSELEKDLNKLVSSDNLMGITGRALKENVLKSAADVGNMVMMVADSANTLMD